MFPALCIIYVLLLLGEMLLTKEGQVFLLSTSVAAYVVFLFCFGKLQYNLPHEFHKYKKI